MTTDDAAIQKSSLCLRERRRRCGELTAALHDLSRAFADALQRTDECLAASKLDLPRAIDAAVGDHARARADAGPAAPDTLRDASASAR